MTRHDGRSSAGPMLRRLRAAQERLPGFRHRSRAWCARCGHRLAGEQCVACGARERPSAPEWIELLADGGSFEPLDPELLECDPVGYSVGPPYRGLVDAARLETSAGESVAAGRARIAKRPVMLVVFDFRFLAGSIGIEAGERIVQALTLAAAERVPVVMVVASSGARMQEGLAALVQMARTSAAVSLLRGARVPFVAVLADPTTGAPFASCANLADVVVAERGALLAFAGPRVVATVTGRAADGTRAEELAGTGAIDAVLPRRDLRAALAELLPLLEPRLRPESVPEVTLPPPEPTVDRWSLVTEIRKPSWPTGVHWLDDLSSKSFELRGDRVSGDDRAIVCALAKLDHRHALVLAHDRLAGNEGLISPAGYRKAVRALGVAGRLGLPVLSLVDTPGAAVGADADRGDIAYWIAQCFLTMLELPVPVLSLVVGQGSSGGALAFGVADRMYMLERSMFSVMSPEGAAAILGRDPDALAEMSDMLKLSAADAFERGLADGVIPGTESGRRAHAKRVRLARGLIARELSLLASLDPRTLVDARRRRYLDLTRSFVVPAAGASPSSPAPAPSIGRDVPADALPPIARHRTRR